MAHLQSAVLFFVDISEMCGSLLPQQVSLFHSIKPLFRNRPLLVLLNKTDLRPMSSLSAEEKALIESMKDGSDESVHFFETSCATKQGVDEARAKACDLLLNKRVTEKVKAGKAESLKTRLHIAGSEAPTNRPAFIPPSVLKQREVAAAGGANDEDAKEEMLEKHRMEELGGAGVYSVDTWKRAMLDNPAWKYDQVPEIMDGMNIHDFVDPDIERKLEELEKEEALLLQETSIGDNEQYLAEFSKTQGMLDELHSRMRQKRVMQRLNKNRNHVKVGRKARVEAKEVETKLNDQGLDGKKVARDRSKSRPTSVVAKRKREASAGDGGAEGSVGRASSKMRGVSQARSISMSRGLSSVAQFFEVEKNRRKRMKTDNKLGRRGEADHWIPDMKPKHLYSGKRGIGKTDRR